MKINPLVVDLSSYQNVSDWSRVRASGIVGVINKVTEGHTLVDRTFNIRAAPTQKVGIRYGAYHFLHPGSIEAQAVHFLTSIEAVYKTHPDLLLALDYEDTAVGVHASLDEAKQWLNSVHDKTGRHPILYSGHVLKEQLGDRIDPYFYGGQTRLWLSHYARTPTWPKTFPAPWLWQFTGDGLGPSPHTVDGIDGGGIDINSFDGTPEQLTSQWADGASA